MGAADEIRAGKLAKFQALEDAGINNHVVEMVLFVESVDGAKNYAGQGGQRRFRRFTLKPNPEIVFSQKTVATSQGFQDESHLTMKGPFPEMLAGVEFIANSSGAVMSSAETNKSYSSPKEFRADIQAADYFLIGGERYKFRGEGFLNVDRSETEWKLRLLKADRK